MKKNEAIHAGRKPPPISTANPFLELMRTALRETAERMLAEEAGRPLRINARVKLTH